MVDAGDEPATDDASSGAERPVGSRRTTRRRTSPTTSSRSSPRWRRASRPRSRRRSRLCRPAPPCSIVRRGPNVGARFLLDADLTVAGRHPDADIFLDDVTVSRRHAEFVRVGTAFQVRDLGSMNGTYFDGVRIESALLVDGAEVQVGKFRLTFYASRLDLATAESLMAGAASPARLPGGSSQLLEHRAGARAAEPGVPRSVAVEAALPRGAAADHPVAHRVGLPQVLARPIWSACGSCCRCSATTTCRSR